MTDPEAQVWMARLTRIWTPKRCAIDINSDTYHFQYKGYWDDRMRLTAACPVLTGIPFFFLHFWDRGRYRHSLVCCTNVDSVIFDVMPHHQELAAQWMPVFRRRCWLSGTDVEATMHEKAEWMQGFSREEVEAWNLKF